MKRTSPDDFASGIPKKPKHYSVYRSRENFTVLPTGKEFEGVSAILLPYSPLNTIPEDLRSLYWLISLDLSCCKLTTLPDSLCTLVNLCSLQLAFNEIAWISPKIDQMTKLEHLDLSNNFLETIPAEVGNLKKLLVLQLHSNRLKSIPSQLNRLTQLHELHLHGNIDLLVPLELGALRFTEIYLNCKRTFNKFISPFGYCQYGHALKQSWKKSTFILSLLSSQFDCDTPILEAFFEVSAEPCVVLK